MASYVNAVSAFVCFELPAQILRIDLLQFHRIYLLYDWSKRFFFFDVLIKDKVT